MRACCVCGGTTGLRKTLLAHGRDRWKWQCMSPERCTYRVLRMFLD